MNESENAFIDISNAFVQPIHLSSFTQKKISADVLRLDAIHGVVSGNKWFKLRYYFKDAISNNYKTILTYGGAWSNHIIATAYAARQIGLQSIGIIRGEEPSQLSNTLLVAKNYGMRLHFVNRTMYAEKETGFAAELFEKYRDAYIIPQGGAGTHGVEGCKEILALTQLNRYSHILCCIGSGTMYAGLVNSSLPGQQLTGIVVLKGMGDGLLVQLNPLIEYPEKINYCKVVNDYHFGGYAKKTTLLIQFINEFYKMTGIPTDFVYTGKLFYACIDLAARNYFPAGSNLLIVHSGGLQGNASLPEGTLNF